MPGNDNIRFITTVIVIVIFLSLQYFYKNKFIKNSRGNSLVSKGLGLIVLVISIAFAWWLMND